VNFSNDPVGHRMGPLPTKCKGQKFYMGPPQTSFLKGQGEEFLKEGAGKKSHL